MKWRPISELSDEQRDGRWWMFSYNDSLAGFVKKHDKTIGGWRDYLYANYGVENDEEIKSYSYFLSEPIPMFPKPQKMEWRKFEDEMPEEESNILIMFDNKKYMVYTNFDSRVLSIAGPEKAEYWMPIVPPEGN